MTFKDIPIGGLFITGPGSHMHMKLDHESPPGLSGGNARFLHSGESVWVPDNREVHKPIKADFTVLADRWAWEDLTASRNPALTA